MSERDRHQAGERFARDYIAELKRVLDALPIDDLGRAMAVLEAAHRDDRIVFLAGNGGSAATASHMANDLAFGVAKSGGRGFRVVSLSDNIPSLTAISNDESFDEIFAKQIDLLGRPGDVLVVISGSGKSPNIVTAARVARERGLEIIGFLGMSGGEVAQLCDVSIVVPSDDYGPIEDVHMMFDHLMTAWLREWSAGRPRKS